MNNKITVISPDVFGENDYEVISLIYYADKVLTYSNGKIITNINDIVGPDALNSFGEYEDDSVFVRNDILKKDIEILLDLRKHSDVATRKRSSSSTKMNEL